MCSAHLTPLLLILHRANTAMIIASIRHQPTMISNEDGQEAPAKTSPEHDPNQVDVHTRSEHELDAEPSMPVAEPTGVDSGAAEPKRPRAVRGGGRSMQTENSDVVQVEDAHEAKLRKQREASRRTRERKKRTSELGKEQKAALDQTIATLTMQKEDLARQLYEQEQESSVKEQIRLRIEQRMEEEERGEVAQGRVQVVGRVPHLPHHR